MHIMTVDVEDWFHTFDSRYYNRSDKWRSLPSTLERNVERWSDFLSEHQIKATFFWLGWSAKRHQRLVRKLSEAGHEIGAHSYHHIKLSDLKPDDFRRDTRQALNILEDVTGKPVTSYRAPGFSAGKDTLWAFEILSELGIQKDSSLFAGRRLNLNHSVVPSEPFVVSGGGFRIKEFPVVGIPLFGGSFNYSGSGYFRISSLHLIKKRLLHAPYMMYYFHPRDFDDGKVKKTDERLFFRLRYKVGTKKTLHKLATLNQKIDFVDLETADAKIQWKKVKQFRL
ncbi:MAG: polysaccharide deacetylase family protein [Bacteroidales bacterium]|nr:polysaccharide deacetylase family protein [Bacteroidales bacterium]